MARAKTVTVSGRTTDARPDRLDLRDRPYRPPVMTLPPACPSDAELERWIPRYARAGFVLDQRDAGASTGFGLASVIHHLLWRRREQHGGRERLVRVSARMLFHLARFYDEWPGEDYDGSSCRGALKAWHRHGVCAESLWPFTAKDGGPGFQPPLPGWDADAMRRRVGVYYRIDSRSVVDMQAAIAEIGVIYAAARIHEGWNAPAVERSSARRGGRAAKKRVLTGHASLPAIQQGAGSERAGHAFAIVGYGPGGFVIQNSWGRAWGRAGFAVLPYEDWVAHGTDAWVCALGVPAPGTRSSAVVTAGEPSTLRRVRSVAVVPAARARTVRVIVNPRVAPWTLESAYRHAVVLGNEGRPLNRIVTHASGEASVAAVVNDAPAAWFKARRGVRRMALYAHGGLNSEAESVARVQVLGPYFEANGIYPIFITWKTGLLESLMGILEDEIASIPRREGRFTDVFGQLANGAAEVLDRTLEVTTRPLVKPLWSQMKQNAEASVAPGRGGVLIAQALAQLASVAGDLEVHLVGHSAGSILLGHFLSAARAHGLAVKTCSLFAPACSVDFAAGRFGSTAAPVLREQDVHVHLLSDEREREDTVGPYQKSLLYLVSRALETSHKTPLFGLEEAFNRSPAALAGWFQGDRGAVGSWQRSWKGNVYRLTAAEVVTGPGRRTRAAHGCFDNDIATMTAVLTRIVGAPPVYPVESLEY